MLSLVHLICRQVRGGSGGSEERWRGREGSRGRGRRGDEGGKKMSPNRLGVGVKAGRLCGGESEQYKEHLKWPI